MLTDAAIEQWRRSITSPCQLDVGHAILDCSTASDDSTRTPQRPPLRLVCPPAPKKPTLKMDPDVFAASQVLFNMKDQGTQTCQSLGTCRVKGMAMHMLRIHHGCPICRTLFVGELESPLCSFCYTPLARSVGTNVGLYHMVPYFE